MIKPDSIFIRMRERDGKMNTEAGITPGRSYPAMDPVFLNSG